jgi:RimJ/RimL family protein N-acetyltransferase
MSSAALGKVLGALRDLFSPKASPFFRYVKYDLFEYYLEEVNGLNEADFLPDLDSFRFEIVRSNHEADQLEKEGLEFRSQHPRYRERLDKGAVAACVFVAGELAYVGWVAMSDKAKESMGEPPYRFKVDFSNGEACAGSIWTNPKYRQARLATYGYLKRLQYLKGEGRTVARSATDASNPATHRLLERLGARLYGGGRLLRILCWESWREDRISAVSG